MSRQPGHLSSRVGDIRRRLRWIEGDIPAFAALHAVALVAKAGRRRARRMRLVQSNGAPIANSPHAALIRLLIKARRWWMRFQVGDVDNRALGKLEGVQAAYIARVSRLAFLAPSVIDGILVGATLPGVDGKFLTLGHKLVPAWSDQEIAMPSGALRR